MRQLGDAYSCSGPPNTALELRGARTRRDEHDDSSTPEMEAAYHASLLLQRRLVCSKRSLGSLASNDNHRAGAHTHASTTARAFQATPALPP